MVKKSQLKFWTKYFQLKLTRDLSVVFYIKLMLIIKVVMQKLSNKMKTGPTKNICSKRNRNARHAVKTPIFVGGGVAHGPKGERACKKQKLNKSEKKLSIASLISEKTKNKNL